MVMPALGGERAPPVQQDSMYSISVEGSPLARMDTGRAATCYSRRCGTTRARPRSYGLHRLTLATGQVEDVGLGDRIGVLRHVAGGFSGRPVARIHALHAWAEAQSDHAATARSRLRRAKARRSPVPDLEPDIHHSLHWSPTSDRLWFSNGESDFRVAAHRYAASRSTRSARDSRSAHDVDRRRARRALAPPSSLWPRTTESRSPCRSIPSRIARTGDAVVRAPSSGVDYHPRISPDGRTLAFISDRGGPRDIWLAEPGWRRIRARSLASANSSSAIRAGHPIASPSRFTPSAPGEPRVIHRVDVESGVDRRDCSTAVVPAAGPRTARSLYVTDDRRRELHRARRHRDGRARTFDRG